MTKPSLYPSERCFVCGNPNTVTHHIYPGTGRREISDREGCTVRLCPTHHNMSNAGVHFNKKLDAWIKADCQRRWEKREGAGHDEFRALFGCNYL